MNTRIAHGAAPLVADRPQLKPRPQGWRRSLTGVAPVEDWRYRWSLALHRLYRLKIGLCLAFGVLAFGISSAAPATAVPGVSFEQRLGAQLPLDAELRDSEGRAVHFGDLLGGRPAVLVFGYSQCPQLCSVVANATVETLRALRQTAGKDFSVLYVSIDPRDTARDLAGLKRRDVGRYGRSGVAGGWRYVGGSDDELHRLAEAAGFHYSYDARQKLYSHASGFLVLTPDGRASQYFLGVDFSAKDVAAALERAAAGRTGESVFSLLLVCARGLGISGKYGRLIWITIEITSALTVLTVFGGIAWMLRQERKQRRSGDVDGMPSSGGVAYRGESGPSRFDKLKIPSLSREAPRLQRPECEAPP